MLHLSEGGGVEWLQWQPSSVSVHAAEAFVLPCAGCGKGGHCQATPDKGGD